MPSPKVIAELPTECNLTGRIRRDDSVLGLGGGFCDVFRGYSEVHRKKVAIRRIRVALPDDPLLTKV